MPLLATIEDLSDLLQVSESTIHRMMKAGLPFIKLGRMVRFKVDRVEKYLDHMNSDRTRLINRRKGAKL